MMNSPVYNYRMGIRYVWELYLWENASDGKRVFRNHAWIP